jgi:hypothetical protein
VLVPIYIVYFGLSPQAPLVQESRTRPASSQHLCTSGFPALWSCLPSFLSRSLSTLCVASFAFVLVPCTNCYAFTHLSTCTAMTYDCVHAYAVPLVRCSVIPSVQCSLDCTQRTKGAEFVCWIPTASYL